MSLIASLHPMFNGAYSLHLKDEENTQLDVGRSFVKKLQKKVGLKLSEEN